MKRYIKSNEDYFDEALQDAIAYVKSLKWDKLAMKCTKMTFDILISEWLADLNDSHTEDDIAYHKEFYLSEIYKKKYSPLV